jgi:tetratricopeptide (TPR) repeat protein
MKSGSSLRSLSIFEDALDVAPDARAAWLAEACDGDEALLAEVKRLLAADELAERAMPTGGLRPDDTPMPARVGHYRIVDRVGQGGMGDVFAAARDDGLFEHVVAIKRVRPSLFPATAQALFERERRALATLSHRHIAQLYDGGVDETGAPFFIMELVRGAPIDRYVADNDLSPRQIVEKVIQVCEAVQHAHQNLIVHADLKPANILVNEAGDPKIVDFGVARLLREEEAEALHPQTRGYASPQRAAGASPTPADDVFALGVVLRVLLTGERADMGDTTTLASHAIETSEAFAGRPAEWRHRRSRMVQGDLDEIIARACAPKAEQRYPAAIALAADLRAWLEIRPLAAKAHDRLHVFRRFVRRRRWRVAGGIAAAAALVIGLSVTTALWTQAEAARKQAEQRFTEVRSLAKYLLYDVHDRLEVTPQSLAMRRDMARVAQGYLIQLADAPSAPADVLLEAADGLVRVADLQAGRSRPNLGEFDEAMKNLDSADAIAAGLVAGPEAAQVAGLRARIAVRRAALMMNSTQELEAAGEQLEAARAYLAEIGADDPARPALATRIALEEAILGNWKGDYTLARTRAEEAVTLARDLLARDEAARENWYLAARAQDALAEAIYYGVGEAGSEPEYRRLVAVTSVFADAHPDDMLGRRMAIEAHWALGTTLLGVGGRTKEALAELDRAAALLPVLLEFEPDDEGARRTQRIVLAAQAQALAMAGRFAEGVALLRGQLDINAREAEAPGARPELVRSQAVTLAMLADLYADNNAPREACPLYAKVETILTGLEQRGLLSQLDRDSSLKMVQARQAELCR